MLGSSPLASHPLSDLETAPLPDIEVTAVIQTSFIHIDPSIEIGLPVSADITMNFIHVDPTVEIRSVVVVTDVIGIDYLHIDPDVTVLPVIITDVIGFTFDHSDPFILVDGQPPIIFFSFHDLKAYRISSLLKRDNIFLPNGKILTCKDSIVLHYIDQRHLDMEMRGLIKIEKVYNDGSVPLYVPNPVTLNKQRQAELFDASGGTASDIIVLIGAIYDQMEVADNFATLTVSTNEYLNSVAVINNYLDEIERLLREMRRQIYRKRGSETVTILN